MAQTGVITRRAAVLSLAAAAVAALGACAEPASTVAAAGGLPPVRVVPGSLLLPAPDAPRAPLRDTCGAAALAGLVGKPKSQIPVPVDLTRRRVACTACPVAPDVRLDRVNILFDAHTGLVTRITCG